MPRQTHSAPPATAVVVRRTDAKEQYAAIAAAIDTKRDAIVATLAPTISPERFLSVALQAVTRSPKLLECTPASIVKALRDAAELGLEPSGLMGSAYLVPYKRNVKDNGNWRSEMEAQLIPGYRGLIDLARRSGEVRTVEAHAVRERDYFAIEFGTGQSLIHKPWLNLTNEMEDVIDPSTGEIVGQKPVDAGPFVAFYALVRLSSGEVQFEVMTVPEIDAIRRRSRAADDGPWVTDYAEMAKKTVTKRLLKYLPLSVVALQRALEIEDAAESSAEPVVTSAPVARARLQAALVPGEQPSVTVEDKSGVDLQSVENRPSEPVSEAPPEPEPTPEPEEEAPASQPGLCGDPSPWGNGETCQLAEGHHGVHRTADSSWPRAATR